MFVETKRGTRKRSRSRQQEESFPSVGKRRRTGVTQRFQRTLRELKEQEEPEPLTQAVQALPHHLQTFVGSFVPLAAYELPNLCRQASEDGRKCLRTLQYEHKAYGRLNCAEYCRQPQMCYNWMKELLTHIPEFVRLSDDTETQRVGNPITITIKDLQVIRPPHIQALSDYRIDLDIHQYTRGGKYDLIADWIPWTLEKKTVTADELARFLWTVTADELARFLCYYYNSAAFGQMTMVIPLEDFTGVMINPQRCNITFPEFSRGVYVHPSLLEGGQWQCIPSRLKGNPVLAIEARFARLRAPMPVPADAIIRELFALGENARPEMWGPYGKKRRQ